MSMLKPIADNIRDRKSITNSYGKAKLKKDFA
jgi:hypothetical protein